VDLLHIREFQIQGFFEIEMPTFRDLRLQDLEISRFKSRIYIIFYIIVQRGKNKVSQTYKYPHN
jgi:hypothetical protein